MKLIYFKVSKKDVILVSFNVEYYNSDMLYYNDEFLIKSFYFLLLVRLISIKIIGVLL